MGQTNKIAVIFNSNQLGGAERSLIEQFSLSQNKEKYDFYLPSLSMSEQKMISFLNEKGFRSIHHYPYPGFIYTLTQKDFKKVFGLLLLFPIVLYFMVLWYRQFHHYSAFYVNGNKASFPILSWATLFRKKIKMTWHFRDYPQGLFFKLIVNCLSMARSSIKLDLVANSYSVADSLQAIFKEEKIRVLYNLPGNLPFKEKVSKIEIIGVVAMPSAWKGLHSIILMSSLYEKELKEMGIKKIVFYGEKIYQTSSHQNDYVHQLNSLKNKLGASLVEWKTGLGPKDIFKEIDLLIHSSIRPEPFGRVIVEAFQSGTPVISTALGGAGELVFKQKFGQVMIPFDYSGLNHLIKALKNNLETVEMNRISCRDFVDELQAKILSQIS